MLINEQVYITLSSMNIKHFEELGYDIESLKITLKNHKRVPRGTKLLVKTKDLKRNSTIRVDVKCDYCGRIFTKQYREYLNGNEDGIIKKDCCSNDECLVKKRNESNLEIYGCENVFQNNEIKEKIKKSIYNKYGVEFALQNNEIKEKIKQTMMLKYGTYFAAQNDSIKQKTIEANIKRYGVSHFSKTNEFKEKTKTTCLLRYGVSHPMKNEEIKNRGVINSILSRYKHGSGISSKQQRYLHDLIGGVLNYLSVG